MGSTDEILVDVQFSLWVPTAATNEQIREWTEFSLNYRGEIHTDNPLVSYDMEADHISSINIHG